MVHTNTERDPSFAERFIQVTGEKRIDVKPDLAQIQVEVLTEGTDITKAQQENAEKMNRVLQSLQSFNIPQEDIQTASYNVSPRYDFIDGKQVFRGYSVTNSLLINIRDLDNVGSIIDTATENGANQISSLEFKLKDQDAHYNKVLQMALQNAHGKAHALATSLGLSYMPIPVEITEESNNAPILFKSAARSESARTTPIIANKVSIEAIITVKYRY